MVRLRQISQGRKENPEPMLFLPAVELYEHIPKKHFYEELNRLLSLSFVYDLTRPLYADRMGRSSLDPVVFFKCMLVAFFENIIYGHRARVPTGRFPCASQVGLLRNSHPSHRNNDPWQVIYA